jgi:hypothetical protein
MVSGVGEALVNDWGGDSRNAIIFTRPPHVSVEMVWPGGGGLRGALIALKQPRQVSLSLHLGCMQGGTNKRHAC